ncbi:hypothetical protein [Prochlorococcus sp. MIT 1300]|uniref:hypothetical protein n=1 Tax=Prochlorococcus sp. MIT 1300 TaxID=3096218 RepID=UPI002A74FA94|nr:hypothetical protein [Prochlorococcus sp. MIT 1300]
MAHLIHVWHERNGWSHRVLPALVESLSLGRVHNSQISNLRNAKLAAPGPEVFLALAQANLILHKGLEHVQDRLAEVHPELLEVLRESSLSLEGDDGKAIGTGDLFEIFVGLAPLPACYNWFIEDEEAAGLSAALADFFCQGKTWRKCRDHVLNAYPVKKISRRERFAEVMAGLRDFTAEELDGELLDLCTTQQILFGEKSMKADGFLEELRTRANNLGIQ